MRPDPAPPRTEARLDPARNLSGARNSAGTGSGRRIGVRVVAAVRAGRELQPGVVAASRLAAVGRAPSPKRPES